MISWFTCSNNKKLVNRSILERLDKLTGFIYGPIYEIIYGFIYESIYGSIYVVLLTCENISFIYLYIWNHIWHHIWQFVCL